MDKESTPQTRCLFWHPSDPLIEERTYKYALFKAMSSQANAEKIELPLNQDTSETILFNRFRADKVASNLIVYELENSRRDTFGWAGAAFPTDPIAILMTVYDPRKWYHGEIANLDSEKRHKTALSIANLINSQKRYLQSCTTPLFVYNLNFPIILVYMREAEQPFDIEILAGTELASKARLLTYRMNDLSAFPRDLLRLLG